MANDESLQGAGITAKERLERIEHVLSAMDSKLDLKFDAIEKRVWSLEVNVVPSATQAKADITVFMGRLDKLNDRIDTIRAWQWRAAGMVVTGLFILEVGLAKGWF